jgi:hypothetical protein
MRRVIAAITLVFIFLTSHAFADYWTTPVPVESGINTGAVEWTPYLSYDSLSLYFARQDGSKHNIYEAKRSQPSGNFTSVSQVLSDSGSDNVLEPWVSEDNLRMYYHHESSNWNIEVSQRASVTDPWSLGTVVSGLPDNIASPTLSQDELTIIFNNPNAGGWDLYMATRSSKDSAFSNIQSLSELNTELIESSPSMSPDGLSVYFFSDRSGLGRIYESTRQSINDPFSNPTLIADIQYGVHWPSISISADGKALYFGDFTGDICVSYNVPEPGTIALFGFGILALRKRHKPA